MIDDIKWQPVQPVYRMYESIYLAKCFDLYNSIEIGSPGRIYFDGFDMIGYQCCLVFSFIGKNTL